MSVCLRKAGSGINTSDEKSEKVASCLLLIEITSALMNEYRVAENTE